MSEFHAYTTEEVWSMRGRKLLDASKALSNEVARLRMVSPPNLSNQFSVSDFYINFMAWQRAVIIARANEGVEAAAKQYMESVL